MISLQELLATRNKLSDSLGDRCFENDFRELHNSSSEAGPMPLFLQKIRLVNQDYITTLRSPKAAAVAERKRTVTHDTSFSFACIPTNGGANNRNRSHMSTD